MKLTILMPCLNEIQTLEKCIIKAKAWIKKADFDAEILIADNGSTDGSQELARSLGARVIDVPTKGYGSVVYAGSHQALGKWIIMGDSDDSYNFSTLDFFVRKLEEGFDLVVGNRFLGGIEPGAMPWKNRYIGNPILTWIGRVLFNSPIRDFHCGMRGFSREAFLKMDLRTTGMEFASEMVIKATIFKMKICEVPTTLSKDGRSRPPHLRPWRDGWRHLRFMLLFSPRWLFLVPGIIVSSISAITYIALYFGPVRVFSIIFDIHTLLFAQVGIVLGLLLVLSGITIRLFGYREGLLKKNQYLDWIFNTSTLEIGTSLGLGLLVWGAILGWMDVSVWAEAGFGALQYAALIRSVSLATLLIAIGGLTFVMSLIVGFLSLPMRREQVTGEKS